MVFTFYCRETNNEQKFKNIISGGMKKKKTARRIKNNNDGRPLEVTFELFTE